jgi:hypothetical protein
MPAELATNFTAVVPTRGLLINNFLAALVKRVEVVAFGPVPGERSCERQLSAFASSLSRHRAPRAVRFRRRSSPPLVKEMLQSCFGVRLGQDRGKCCAWCCGEARQLVRTSPELLEPTRVWLDWIAQVGSQLPRDYLRLETFHNHFLANCLKAARSCRVWMPASFEAGAATPASSPWKWREMLRVDSQLAQA